MKTIFLTSSPFGPLDNSRTVEGFDSMNRLPENLSRFWKKNARCLVISAFPSDIPACINMRDSMEQSIHVNFPDIACLDIWDDRTEDFSAQTLASYDVVFLGGGHVPTENAFFEKIGLRENIQKYNGLVIGISAGTMNAAEVVYAQPELDGEAVDPEYRRFIKGLGLTKINILPHYQMTGNFMLDGMRLFEDITYGDSCGRRFLVLPDGSYYTSVEGQGTVWGEAYEIADGKMRLICRDGEYLSYGSDGAVL